MAGDFHTYVHIYSHIEILILGPQRSFIHVFPFLFIVFIANSHALRT